MNKEKMKYGLKVLRNYLEVTLVLYLVYAFVRTVSGLSIPYTFAGSTGNLKWEFRNFYCNTHIYVNSLAGLKHQWILLLEILFIFIVPALIIIGLELKKHNEKIKGFFEARREKRLIRLQKQLNDLKDKEL